MKTNYPITYSFGYVTVTIPAGTTCIPAKNLPHFKERELYWAKGWRGMTKQQRSWHKNYGFLLTLNEIKNGLPDTNK